MLETINTNNQIKHHSFPPTSQLSSFNETILTFQNFKSNTIDIYNNSHNTLTFYHHISETKAENILKTEDVGTFLVCPWNISVHSNYFTLCLKFFLIFIKMLLDYTNLYTSLI